MSKRKAKRRIQYRNKHGERVSMDATQAGEMLIGGLVGLYSLGVPYGISDKASAALLAVLREVVDLSRKTLERALARLNDDSDSGDVLRRVFN